MSDKGKELYEKVKQRIGVLETEGTWEYKFGNFWKFLCGFASKQRNLRHMYEDSVQEFIDKYKDRLMAMKEDFLENIDYYVEKCIKVMREVNNMTVYLAKTNEEAHGFLLKEIGDAKVLYKSKSNEAKDIGVLDVLKKNNIEVKETDLGDVLVHMFDYKLPTFGVGPGIHFSREDIVAKIKEVYGVELEPTPRAIVDYFRETYRKELLNNVTVSLTSANVISAEDGAIVLGENEGNISLLTRATEKHIVLCGITKIVPTILDAILVAKLQTRINNISFNYISIISGPSATGDIQGEKVLGMYGAKEVVVILVDDWRTKALNENLFYQDFLRCISCKTCNYTCTASRAFGNIFASKYGLGADGIIRDYIHNGIEAAIKDGLFFCTGCENCRHWCPVSINLGEIMKSLKKEAYKAGLCPPPLKEYQQKILNEKNPFK